MNYINTYEHMRFSKNNLCLAVLNLDAIILEGFFFSKRNKKLSFENELLSITKCFWYDRLVSIYDLGENGWDSGL